ncbi:unnamed protein product [Oppiella nova]|uniref:Uncharacterized protein n=1 Tax=Oppiella nova TaxID=334625 RepID=A0A7R9M857_9ACAR|nr:unnamed protein product [Oppiella nova]CAG2172586.1 unnamed protein product [Oppiella nova]
MWTTGHLTVESGPVNQWPKTRKFLFLICLIAFMYQIFQITRRYYKYDVEIRTKQLERRDRRHLDIPAVTICTGSDVAYLKKTLYREFPKIKQSFVEIDKQNLTDEKTYVQKELRYYMTAWSLDYKSYFKHTIQERDFMRCYLNPPTIYMKSHEWTLRAAYCRAFAPVVETRVTPYGKCFTYFSRQDSEFKDRTDMQIDVNDIDSRSSVVSLVVSMDKFADAIYGGDVELNDVVESTGDGDVNQNAYMFIHEGTRTPSFDLNDAIVLTAGKYYDVRFWSTSRQKLKPPFPHNCYDYHKDMMSKESAKSREQCVRNCYVRKSSAASQCLVARNPLVNDHTVRSYDLRQCYNPMNYFSHKSLQITIKNGMDYKTSQRISSECQKSCREDCHQTDYHYDYRKSDHHLTGIHNPNSDFTLRNFSWIRLRHRRDHDYQQRYRPVHTMCETIRDIFITMLIWFGLSIFSFSSVLEMIFSRARPQIYAIPYFNDKVEPNIIQVMPPPANANLSNPATLGVNNACMSVTSGTGLITPAPVVKPKFTATNMGSNVKLDHYNAFISKVYEGCPDAPVVELPLKKS